MRVDEFLALPSAKRAATLLTIQPLAVRMKLKRLLSPAEQEQYRRLLQKHQEDTRRQIEAEKRKKQQDAVFRYISFYRRAIENTTAIRAVLNAWDGKRLTKKFRQDLQNVSCECEFVAGGSMRLWMNLDNDTCCILVSTDQGIWEPHGRTLWFRAAPVLQNMENHVKNLMDRIDLLIKWECLIPDIITTYNNLMAQAECILQSIPPEYRKCYRETFQCIRNK